MNAADQIIIYGAGNTARAMLEAGIKPLAFLDRARRGELGGVRIVAPDDLHLSCRKLPVISAVFSPPADCGNGFIAAALTRLGYDPPIDFERFYQSGRMGSQRTFMWLAPSAYFQRHAAELADARALLADDTSRDLFDLQLRHRLGEPWTILPPPSPAALQYRDPSIPAAPPDGFFFVDVGAFTGDTLPENAGRVLALEPDPANFAQLQAAAARRPDRQTRLVRAAAGRTAGHAGFASGGAAGKLVSGAPQVETVRLDDLLDSPPDYVKFDVEGAEADAIAGMASTIAEHAPLIAAAVYHRPEDIFAIPLALAALQPRYRFRLRCYGEHCMETILYAAAE